MLPPMDPVHHTHCSGLIFLATSIKAALACQDV